MFRQYANGGGRKEFIEEEPIDKYLSKVIYLN